MVVPERSIFFGIFIFLLGREGMKRIGFWKRVEEDRTK